MKRFVIQTVTYLVVSVAAALSAVDASAKSLDIYFIDVEGGQSTLIVTPQGQTLLIDTGYRGDGGPQAKFGDPTTARDPQRILTVAHEAGVSHIDYLLITHFHGDHLGGVVELSQLMPIYAFVDHGSVPAEAEQNVPGTLEIYNAYTPIRAKRLHVRPKPGYKLPLKGVDVTVVSTEGFVLDKPLAGAGKREPACPSSGVDAQESIENPRSTGVRLQFGKFKFLDLGDLTGAPLFSLACPANLIGPVDVYLVAHHGGRDAAEPATFAAFKPRVAIMNNGEKKGGALETYKLLHHVDGLEDVWQVHRSSAAGDENFAPDRIANLDESTAHWIKLSAEEDGSFKITNGRTGASKTYRVR